MQSKVIGLILVAAAGTGAYFAFAQPAAPATPEPATQQPLPTPPSAPAPASGVIALPPAKTSATNADGYIAYPDGTFYPPLNGVKVAPKMSFNARLSPFTKVVGMERDNTGRDWYVHENGLRSTTYVNRLGVATYEIVKPVEPAPILPDEVPGGTGR